MRRLLLACGSLLLLLVPALGYVRLQSSNQTLSWSSGAWPLGFVVGTKDLAGNPVSEAKRLAIRCSFQSWEDNASSDIDFTEDTSAAQTSRTDYLSTDINLVIVDPSNLSDQFASSTVVAVTGVGFTGTTIVGADILINGQLNFSTKAIGVGGSIDLQNVITHEVGHFIGLDHPPVTTATMHATTATGETMKRSLSADDIAGAVEIRAVSGAAYGTFTGGPVTISGGGGTAAYPLVAALDATGFLVSSVVGDASGNFSFRVPSGQSLNVYATPFYGASETGNAESPSPATTYSMTFYGGNASPAGNSVVAGGSFSWGALSANTEIASGIKFTYPPPSGVSALFQAVRGASTTVTLKGTFQATMVSEMSCPDAQVSGDGGNPSTSQLQFTATAAAGANLGDVDVRLKEASSEKRIVASGVLEVIDPAPTISSLSVTSGTSNGGTQLTISGTGFQANAKVVFGEDSLATVNSLTSTSINISTPAHSPGTVSVGVANPGGQGAFLNNAFIYNPQITAVSGTQICFTGGNPLTVTGAGFQSGATVTIGGVPCTGVTVDSSTQISCVTPAIAAGSYQLVVTNPDGGTATAADTFSSLEDCGGGGGGGCFSSVRFVSPGSGEGIGLLLPFAILFLVAWRLRRRAAEA